MAILDRLVQDRHGDLGREFESVTERLQGSTVQVRGRGPGGGSGVIWRPDGLIVTNAHVARDPEAHVQLADGRDFDGEVVARDAERDLAAIQLHVTGLPAAAVVDSDALSVGQLVLAVGNPLGMVGATTLGIVHALAPVEGHGRHRWVQADVRLLPGNSGGPLADVTGRVIGINSMVAGGLGLAVPSNEVQRFLGIGSSFHLGVTAQPVPITLGSDRVLAFLVLDLAADSPAERADLILGDLIVGEAGIYFRSPRDLSEALQTDRPFLSLDVLRAGKLIRLDFELQRERGAAA